MVIAKARRTGNWRRVISMGRLSSEGSRVILGMKTSFLHDSPQNATLQDPWSDFQQNHTCSITETIDRVNVAKKHKGTSRLKREMWPMEIQKW